MNEEELKLQIGHAAKQFSELQGQVPTAFAFKEGANWMLTLIREAGWRSPEEVKQIENKAFKDGCELNYEPDEEGGGPLMRCPKCGKLVQDLIIHRCKVTWG